MEPLVYSNIFQRIYNAKDYGVVGDGTTDDRAAMQTFLDAIPNYSIGMVAFDSVLVADSSIKLRTSTVAATRRGITLWLGNTRFKTTTALKGSDGGQILGIIGEKDSMLYDITVVGGVFDDQYTDSTLNNGIGVAYVDGIIIQEVLVVRASRKGISTHWSKNQFIINNVIENYGFAGITVEYGDTTEGVWIMGNRVMNLDTGNGSNYRYADLDTTDSWGWHSGIVASNIAGRAITNVHIHNNTVTINEGETAHSFKPIFVFGDSGSVVSGNITTVPHRTYDVGPPNGRIRPITTDSTKVNVSGYYLGRHYDWTEQDILAMQMFSASGTSILNIGGGDGSFNSAEKIEVFTGRGDVELTGIQRLQIDSTGIRVGTDAGGYTLPLTDGTINQVPVTDGSGAVTWTAQAGGGTSDSMGIDTDGDGTVDNYLYSTTAGAMHIKKGSNITLTVSGDTVIITGSAGSGTADSIGVDTDGDGTVDGYMYSTTAGSAHLKEGTGMVLTLTADTVDIATTLGVDIALAEMQANSVDSTKVVANSLSLSGDVAGFSSANLSSRLSDETGTLLSVFSGGPTFTLKTTVDSLVGDSAAFTKFVATGTASGTITFSGTTSGSAAISVPDIAGTPNEIQLPDATAPTSTFAFLRSAGGNPQLTSWTNIHAGTNITFTTPSDSAGVDTFSVSATGGSARHINVGNADTVSLVGTSDTLWVIADTGAFTSIETENTSGFLFLDQVTIDGQKDSIQLRVQAFSSQTEDIFVVEESDGTDIFEIQGTGEIHATHAANQDDDYLFLMTSDAAGFGGVKTVDIDYITGAMASGDEGVGVLVNIDQSASAGGDVHAFQVLTTTIGTATAKGLVAGVGVVPISQQSGSFTNLTFAESRSSGGYSDWVVRGNSAASDTTLWGSDNDTVFVGFATTFEEIEWLWNTVATKDMFFNFFYSTGAGAWTVFSPIDGTNGALNNGIMAWGRDDLSGWSSESVDGDAAFWIIIIRTRNVATGPTEDLVKVADPTNYEWDASGNVIANSFRIEGTEDAFEHIITGVDATADRTFTFPDDVLADLDLMIGTGAGTFGYAAMSGDATLANTGALTIGTDKIDSTHVVANSLSLPSDVAVFTIAELETGAGGVNILVESEIDAGSELLALYDDETGTGVPVFNIAPDFTDLVTFDSAAGVRMKADSIEIEGDVIDDLTGTGLSLVSSALTVTGRTDAVLDPIGPPGGAGSAGPGDSVILELSSHDAAGQYVLFIDSSINDGLYLDTIYIPFRMPAWASQLDSIMIVWKGKSATGDSAEISQVNVYGPDRSSPTETTDSLYATFTTDQNSSSITTAKYQVANTELNARDPFTVMIETTLGASVNGVVFVYSVYAVVSE